MFLLIAGYFAGVLPFNITVDTTTENFTRGGFIGRGEVFQPSNRKGFITSWRTNGLSESIVVQGKLKCSGGTWDTPGIQKYKYVIEGHKKFGGWEVISKPGLTSMAVSNPNPGTLGFPSNIYLTPGAEITFPEDYDFEIMGNDYDALKCEFWIYMDYSILNPFDDGFYWTKLQVDYASLYEGWGGLYLPKDSDGRPRSTFEIGETVNIGVETTYGGQTVGEINKPWVVKMNYPADRGGGVFKQQEYEDLSNSYFTFTVTEDMFSTSSTNTYKIELLNTVLPQGQLQVESIDLLAKAPSDVTFSGPTKSKIGNAVNIGLSASTSSETQLDIDCFKVSVIYGTKDVLLPSDPNSRNWIIPTFYYGGRDGQKCNNPYTISFTPEREGYVTVHAKAYDIEGRSSLRTQAFTLYAWSEATGEPDDDIVDDETGQHDYGGGKTDSWMAWDPSGGNWNLGQYELIFILAIICLIMAISIIIALFVPVPGGFYGKIAVILTGVIISALVFFLV